MTVTESLARDCTWDINTGSISVPDWTPILGWSDWDFSPSSGDADTRTAEDDGWDSSLKAMRGASYTLTGLRQEDPDNGDRDEGQEAVEVLSRAISTASVGQFRLTFPSGTTLIFLATVEAKPAGGGKDSPNAWNATLKQTGAPTWSDATTVPEAPDTVAGTEDDTFSVITWSDNAGSPDRYEIRVLVSGAVVTTHASTAPEIFHFPGLTNGTAYTAQVRARNAGGWGPWSTASSAFTPAV